MSGLSEGLDFAVSHRTFVELIQSRAKLHPERTAIVYLRDGESAEERLSFREFDARAKAVAAMLAERLGNQRPGSTQVLLLYTGCLEFAVAFVGCLYAGVVAVPAYPP